MIQGTLEYSSPSVAAVAAAGSLHRGMEKRDTSDFTWENWKYGHYLHRAASCVLDPVGFPWTVRSVPWLYVASHVARVSGKDKKGQEEPAWIQNPHQQSARDPTFRHIQEWVRGTTVRTRLRTGTLVEFYR